MSLTIQAKKQGNVFTVYEGPGGKPMPIATFESEPGGFPRTFTNPGELKQAYPGAVFEFVERPVQRRTQAPAAAHEVKLKPQPTSPQGMEQTALNYFRRLLDRYHWCADDVRDEVKIQVEATAETLIELMPEIQEKLNTMKESGKRFKL